MSGGRRTSLTDKQIYWAHYVWNLGYTYKEIAEALFVSEKTVARAIRIHYECQNRKRKRPKLVYKEEKWHTEH